MTVPLDQTVVLGRFRERLTQPDAPCQGHVGRGELSLTIRQDQQHAWSPWVSLDVYPSQDGTTLRGHIGPAPHLWGLFVAIYATFVFGFIAGTVYGYVQWSLGWDPVGFKIGVGSLVALGASCGVDLAGRRVGQGQMDVIHDFIEATLRSPTIPS